MMQQRVDWRHYVAAAVMITAMLTAGFQFLGRGYAQPNAPAPAGANPRTTDAPTYAPGTAAPATPPAKSTTGKSH